ncbi:conserved hypothetical protein [Methylocella silvestris BL2]|uniref:DUF4239 domain-containing protein n=1 Tax=Methylocella silvestris (strain DSM 15510 / CIP 108128 / LMG 27833 / NCIMB 13906 / BL2) TaxID=395965 RepID=B8ES40_METSB|nr:DUF4239 domain-containing protein [Methylocella silvestris]ACK52255.1 conserved hypothetical protein [Methylocella silvestris BL2]
MSYAVAISIVLAAALLAAVVTAIIQRWIDFDVRRQHHEVGSVVFLQLGVVFAVLLAFVFSGTWNEYNDAAQAANLEAGALHGAALLAATLPAADAAAILSAEQSYLQTVVSDEYPVVAKTRGEDTGSDQKLQMLIKAALNVRTTDPDQHDTKNAILSLLTQAHTQRGIRIYEGGSGVPIALWCVLIGLALVLALSVSFSALQYASTAVAVAACFSAGIASILIVARLLDYPFEGALAQPPNDFVNLGGKVSALLNATSAAPR